MYETRERCDIRQTAMLYPTVTELARGTAHPESQASETMCVALSPGLEPSVANTSRGRETTPAHGDLRRRPGVVVRLGRRDQESSAGQHASHTSDPAQWRGQQAA
jgi:hypothetical protein